VAIKKIATESNINVSKPKHWIHYNVQEFYKDNYDDYDVDVKPWWHTTVHGKYLELYVLIMQKNEKTRLRRTKEEIHERSRSCLLVTMFIVAPPGESDLKND